MTRPPNLLRLWLVIGLVVSACASDAGSATSDATAFSTTTALVPTTSTTVPATTSTSQLPVDPLVNESLDVATRFMNAFASKDLEVMRDTAVEGHVFGFVVDQFDHFPNEFSWLEAVGWEMEVKDCFITNPDFDNLSVTCLVSHENLWSRALALGPYDSEFFLKVAVPGYENWIYEDRDEPVVTTRAFAQFPTFFFTNETWDPFINWVETNHPEDIPVMLVPGPPSDIALLPANPYLTAPSIALWGAHTEAFVAENG